MQKLIFVTVFLALLGLIDAKNIGRKKNREALRKITKN